MRPIDIALSAGRKRLSPQTGWIHFCYESDSSRHDTIPIFENFCFILALFRSRLSEDVLLGKEKLEKLLAFEVDGHFPIYLHEYPYIRDKSFSLDLLPIFIPLSREFALVLGEGLLERLNGAIKRILQHEEPTSYGRHAKKLAAHGKFQLEENRKVASSSQLGEEFLALQIQSDRVDLSSLARYWHPSLLMYRGPYAREMQEGFEPAPTLFDLFMGRSIPSDHPLNMRASLVYPITHSLPQEKENHLFIHDPDNQSILFFWRGADRLHSFVIRGVTRYEMLGDNRYAFDCVLPEDGPKEGEEKNEVNGYLDYHPSHEIRVEGEKGTAFTLDEKLHIQSNGLALEIKAQVNEGAGSFYGHLLRGNRPRQIALRGEKKFISYDWQIAFRTVARKGPCTLRILINVRETLLG